MTNCSDIVRTRVSRISTVWYRSQGQIPQLVEYPFAISQAWVKGVGGNDMAQLVWYAPLPVPTSPRGGLGPEAKACFDNSWNSLIFFSALFSGTTPMKQLGFLKSRLRNPRTISDLRFDFQAEHGLLENHPIWFHDVSSAFFSFIAHWVRGMSRPSLVTPVSSGLCCNSSRIMAWQRWVKYGQVSGETHWTH